MDCYSNAKEWHNGAKIMANSGEYRLAIYHCCMAVELYLKSRLPQVPHRDDLEESHDVIGVYKALSDVYGKDNTIDKVIPKIRKYINESRYPSNPVVKFDKSLADEFIGHVADVNEYVDTKCMATLNDLSTKFRK